MAKDSPKTTTGELQNSQNAVSGPEKPLKKKFKQHLHHHMLFGRVSRKIILAHPKTNSSIFSFQTQLELQVALAYIVNYKCKQKN